jgi:hypothetical protein
MRLQYSLVLTLFVLFGGCVSHAQQSTELRRSESHSVTPNGVGVQVDYFQQYGLDEASFKACFKNEYIPVDFPKLTDYPGLDVYKTEVGAFMNKHPHLFKAEEVAKYGFIIPATTFPSEAEIRQSRAFGVMSEDDRILHEQKSQNSGGQ